jgi:serine/threonine-protein kinase
LNRALEISPGHADASYFLGVALVAAGRANDAIALARRSQLAWFRLTFTALAQHDLGNAKESQAALDALIAGHSSESAYQIAQVHAWRGGRDRAFEWLERAYAQRDTGLPGFQNDPLLRKLHEDPRWKPFLKKLNVPVD